LPTVIRALGLAHAGRRERDADKSEELQARLKAIEAVIARLETLASERALSGEIIRPLRARHRDRLRHVRPQSDGDDDHSAMTEIHCRVELLLIGGERQEGNEMVLRGKLKDEARRRIERELDLREAGLANQRDQG